MLLRCNRTIGQKVLGPLTAPLGTYSDTRSGLILGAWAAEFIGGDRHHYVPAVSPSPAPLSPVIGAPAVTATTPVATAVALELQALGVEHFFLMTGRDNLLWIALDAVGIRQILTRSESAAVYMADAYARLTGKPTFVYGAYGPGAANVAGSMAEPYWSGSPGDRADVRHASSGPVAKRVPGTRPDADVLVGDQVGCRSLGSGERPEAGARSGPPSPQWRTGSRVPGRPERPPRGRHRRLPRAGAARRARRDAARSAGSNRCGRRSGRAGPDGRLPADHHRRQRHPSVRGPRRAPAHGRAPGNPRRHEQCGQGQHRRNARAGPGQRRALLAQLRQRRGARRGLDPRDRDPARRSRHRLLSAHQPECPAHPRDRRSRGDRPELPDRAGPCRATRERSSRRCSTPRDRLGAGPSPASVAHARELGAGACCLARTPGGRGGTRRQRRRPDASRVGHGRASRHRWPTMP